jgi:hypothetical protein
MNIDKYRNQHNNSYSIVDKYYTSASDRHILDIHPLMLYHNASTWFVVQTCASLCVLLSCAISLLDILLFFWTLVCGIGLYLIIRRNKKKVTFLQPFLTFIFDSYPRTYTLQSFRFYHLSSR